MSTLDTRLVPSVAATAESQVELELDDIVDFCPQPVHLVHIIQPNVDIRACDRRFRRRMRRDHPFGGCDFLALDPARRAHGIALQQLRRDQLGAAACLQPLPCLFIDGFCLEDAAVTLFCGEHFMRFRHIYRFQLRDIAKLHDLHLSMTRVAVQQFFCQWLWLAPRTGSSTAAAGSILCHVFHLFSADQFRLAAGKLLPSERQQGRSCVARLISFEKNLFRLKNCPVLRFRCSEPATFTL